MASPSKTGGTSSTVKVPSEVLKKNKIDTERRKKAEALVSADTFLRKLFARDKKRQETTNKSTLDLWWERGNDVISVRRKSAEETDAADEAAGGRAKYGDKAVTLLANALGLEPRAFHRAADFVNLFDENTDKKEKFFSKLARDYGAEAQPTWTHVEVMLKEVTPTHKDKLGELYGDLLTTVARESLSTRAFGDMLKKRFRANRLPKRRMDARLALRQLEAALDKAAAAIAPAVNTAVDTISEDVSEVVDPQAVSQAVLLALSKVTDVAGVLADAERRLSERSVQLQQYVASLAPAGEPPAPDAPAEDQAQPTAGEAETPSPSPEPAVAA